MNRICRYWRPELGPTIGVVIGDQVYDLAVADPRLFHSWTELICSPGAAARLAAAAANVGVVVGIAFADLDVPPDPARPHLLAPITKQEVWAAGVTYLRSREARMDESAGGGSFYDRVYTADRPELFFKATPNRV